MPPLSRLPIDREEIRTVYAEGAEAMIAWVEEWVAENTVLKADVATLTAALDRVTERLEALENQKSKIAAITS